MAIEPSTGEILAIVSSPFYNADDLTGSRRCCVRQPKDAPSQAASQ